MKIITRISALLAVCVLALCVLAPAAFAENTSYEIDELYMSIPIPNDMLAITRDSEKTDSFFSKFSLDYQDTMDNFEEGDIYLQAVKEDSSLTLTVTMTKDEESEKTGSYNSLSDEKMTKIKSNLLKSNNYKSASIVTYNNVRYLNLTMSTKSGKKIIQSQQYQTVINGENIVITMSAAPGEKLDSDDKELFEEIISGTRINEQNFFTKYQSLIIAGSATLIGVIIVVVVLIIVIKRVKNPDRKHRHLVHELAHEHKITATTQIPRTHIDKITKPTRTFLTNYEPYEEGGKKKKKTAAAETREEKHISEPVIDEILAEAEPIVAEQEKPRRESKPMPIKRVSDEPKIDEEVVPIAKPMLIEEQEVDEAVERALKNRYIAEQLDEPEVDEFDELEEIDDIDAVEETDLYSGEEVAEEEYDELEEAVQSEEEFEQVEDYFDDVPEDDELYSYDDVDSAVDEYAAAQRESQQIREDRREVIDGFKNVIFAIGRGLKTAGIAVWKALKAVFSFIVYLFIHIGYFCVNCYRMIKRSLKRRKMKKQEEERRRRAAERRRAEREAERARRRQNANRGENDLVKVRSSYESRPSQRRPQQRSGSRPQQRSGSRPQQRRSGSSRPQQRNSSPRDRRY